MKIYEPAPDPACPHQVMRNFATALAGWFSMRIYYEIESADGLESVTIDRRPKPKEPPVLIKDDGMWQTDGYFDKLHLKLAETEAKLAIAQKALDDYHK